MSFVDRYKLSFLEESACLSQRSRKLLRLGLMFGNKEDWESEERKERNNHELSRQDKFPTPQASKNKTEASPSRPWIGL